VLAYPAGMDLSNPVLSGLIRKRQELADDLDAAQAQLARVVASLDALDATIRLFSPDLDLDAARVRPARRVGEPRHETTRQALRIMREAGKAMSHRDITVAIMLAEARSIQDCKVVEVMRRRVSDCVRRLVKQKVVEASEAVGGVLRWRLANVSRQAG